MIGIGKKYFFSDEVTFSTAKKGPTLYTVLLAPDSTTDIPPFVPEVVENLCRVGGGFFVVQWAQSIAGNSTRRNINGCWNAIWFFMLGYYNLMESNFSRIIIEPTHLN